MMTIVSVFYETAQPWCVPLRVEPGHLVGTLYVSVLTAVPH